MFVTGITLISAERERQLSAEGWTAEHDDGHDDGSLALAACCYAAPVKLFQRIDYADGVSYHDPWPWGHGGRGAGGNPDKRFRGTAGNVLPDPESYTDEQRLDLLIKAGALIAAEIDRLLRLTPSPEGREDRE